jgi:hypothetical protein
MTSELWKKKKKKCCQCGLWTTISCRSRETSSKSWAGGFHNDELDTTVVMGWWWACEFWSGVLFCFLSCWQAFGTKCQSLSDIILQMSCTLLLCKTFSDSGFPSHDLLKCHLLVRSSQPSDNQNPFYVLQKWWWWQFEISCTEYVMRVCSSHLWEQSLIICCSKCTCLDLWEHGTWDHVPFMGYSHFHHVHIFSHVVSLIIPRLNFIALRSIL